MSQGWPMVPLGDLLLPVSRAESVAPDRRYDILGAHWYAKGLYTKETKYGSEIAASKVYRVEEGDFVYNRLFAWKGSFALATAANHGCYVSNEFPCFAIDRERLEPGFILHNFSRTSAWTEALGLSSGGTPTSRNRLKEAMLLRMAIPLPPLPEQRRIVAKVEELAAKIEEARRLRRNSGQEADSVVSSELRYALASLETRYGARQLESVLTDAGYGTSEKCHADRRHDAIPVLRIPNVVSEKVDLTGLKYAVLPDPEAAKVNLKEGDILVVRTNGSAGLVGRCAVVPPLPESHAFASYLIRLRCDREQVEPDYLQLALRHLRASGQLFDFARTTAGQYNVSIGRLNAARLPVPPKPEQRRLVATIATLQAKVDALKALQAHSAAELDALLPSVLDKAFKGDL